MLAREIAGPDANNEIRERACQFAEAQIDLCRIRSARLQLLSRALADPEYYSRVNDRKISALLQGSCGRTYSWRPILWNPRPPGRKA